MLNYSPRDQSTLFHHAVLDKSKLLYEAEHLTGYLERDVMEE